MNEWKFRFLFFHCNQNRENKMLFLQSAFQMDFVEGRKYDMKGGREGEEKEEKKERKMGGRVNRKKGRKKGRKRKKGVEGERLIICRHISLSSHVIKYHKQPVT